MRILLFGGTTEGRLLAQELIERGHTVATSVATEVGAEELATMPNASSPRLKVLVGRLDADAIAGLLAGFDLCVDATHPYARAASAAIREACGKTGTPLRRVVRARSDTAGCVHVASAREAAELLAATEGPVLLTTGAKELPAFDGLDPTRLFVRILPTHEGLATCEQLGIPHRNVIALQGPFSAELNEALMRQYGIRWLVTKDGGAAGGLAEKLSAAERCGVQTVLIARPDGAESDGTTVEGLLAEIGPAKPEPVMGEPRGKRVQVTLVGAGGTGAELLPQAADAVTRADLIVGAARLVATLPPTEARVVTEVRPREVARILRESDAHRAVVLLSGDVGFYSGAAKLREALKEDGHEVRLIPGVSSVQLLAARLGRSWQDWTLRSAHGRDCDVVGALRTGQPLFLLTSGSQTVDDVCRTLTDAGLADATVTVAERLGYPDERIRSGTAGQMADGAYDALNVMLVETSTPFAARRAPGIPDEEFTRVDVPMTKQEVRACILAKLAVTPDDVCWDVGAGTGAVSVELAHAAREVWAVEHNPTAAALVRENRARLGAWNLHVVEGTAPAALVELPRPDAVFVGGSSGNLAGILDAALVANPELRLCVSAIALQTLGQAVAWMDEHGLNPEVTQIAVSRTRKAGKLHLLMANNPVFLVVGTQR